MSDSFLLGPIRVYYYSLVLLAAVWLSYSLVIKNKQRFKLTTDQLTDLFVELLVGGIVGARLAFVVQNLSYYWANPFEILRLTTGGLSIHGAILGGLVVIWWYSRKYHKDFLGLTDNLVVPLLVGQIIGRIGNFTNQELFGYPTHLPWKIFINPAHRPVRYLTADYFHPAFAYEMILDCLGLIILSRLKPKKTGQLTAGYLIVTSISRFITEVFRISDRIVGPLSLAQLTSLALFVAGIALWLSSKKSGTKSG